ncbi:putative dehydrogenase [Granulicella aggregans]|uniref:Putative dehydrogenase n=1 Tax=Granulicella aggregans TaxID=474949 RepID=A0A7W7ZJ89_9BACT|nr:Gfo/Idh/MocA family oxidoreductase [Granulicella aggregans]MBB5060936.1 putative dehydrogenase [Granulicella aggregans]
MNRRELLYGVGASAVGFSLLGLKSSAERSAPSDKLTVACIGTGSQGLRVLLDLLRLPQVRVVAVCDVNRLSSDYLDWGPNELRDKVRTVLGDTSWGANHPGPTSGRDAAQSIVNAFYGKQSGRTSTGCVAYEDFRELLAKQKDLDAVAISTPDHWHAVIAIAAMRAGKHVYSQKPMAHNVWECREMVRVAAQTHRATQVSIFNSNLPASHQIHDILTSGAIGSVRSVDIWTKRASKFWLQGLATPIQADPVPAGLNWDMWIGPAPFRPFNHAYMPFIWRAWYDFGCGAFGDMGEYGFDTLARVLSLPAATRIEASTTDRFPVCYPVASAVHMDFDATSTRPALRINWLDGGIEPARPPQLPVSEQIGEDGEGVIYHGEHGKLLTAFMGQNPRVLSPSGKLEVPFPKVASAPEPFRREAPELGGTASGANAAHYVEWIDACKGGPPARANYAFEAPIVETLLLGCIAVRTHEPLVWDAERFAFTQGSAKATALLKPDYRVPWEIASK